MKEHLKLLGYMVKDKITGFEGVVTSICFDLYGCVQAVVHPPYVGDKEKDAGRYFDTKRLERRREVPVMPAPDFTVPPHVPAAESVAGPAEKPPR